MPQKVAFRVAEDKFEAEAEGRSVGPFPFSNVQDVWFVRYGDDFSGPSPDAFWIIRMINSAVVFPDSIPAIRTELIPKLSATQGARVHFKQASCAAPPKNWTASGGFLRTREVRAIHVALQELDAITQTFADVHTVTRFEEGSL